MPQQFFYDIYIYVYIYMYIIGYIGGHSNQPCNMKLGHVVRMDT